jgi:hypothetical protein
MTSAYCSCIMETSLQALLQLQVQIPPAQAYLGMAFSYLVIS